MSDGSKAKFSKHMIDMLVRQGIIFIGTTSAKGVPNVSVRTAFSVFGDDTIIILDYFRHKTFWNWQENNNVAISVVDKEKLDGYQFKGSCELVTDPKEIEQHIAKTMRTPYSRATVFARAIQGLPPTVIKFTIREIYSLKPQARSFEAIF